jgi:prolyl-tRNA synthetase
MAGSLADILPSARKYRDELRPRQGLLRSREFVMKDLYTFDYSAAFALETYHEVREAYAKLFDELKIPYLVADADSGDMGGNLSHEFHFPTSKGEDNVISCTTCNYVANEELAESAVQPYGGSGQEDLNSLENENAKAQGEGKSAIEPRVWRGISRDRNTLINIWYASGSDTSRGMPGHPELNLHAVKAILPEFDASIEDPMSLWTRTAGIASTKHEVLRLVNLVDCRLPYHSRVDIESQNPRLPFWPEELNCQFPHINMETLSRNPLTGRPLNLLRIRDGDPCARCSAGVLKVQKAIELGHTFYLGTRYSDPLDATVTVPGHLLKDKDHSLISSAERSDSSPDQKVPMQMGCHGIGVSRMIAAVADTLADEKGLNWPRVMAPFEVVVVPGNGLDHAASEIYDALSSIPSTSGRPQLDVILDDRTETFPWKMRDADLVGYPVIVVVGRRWKADRICEVQCRRLQVRQDLPLGEIRPFVASLLDKL